MIRRDVHTHVATRTVIEKDQLLVEGCYVYDAPRRFTTLPSNGALENRTGDVAC